MELDEAIKTAIEYEAGVHRTYQEAMQRATDAKAKRFFEVLRDEEMDHLKYLRERLEEWTRTRKVQVAKLDTAIPSHEAIDHGLQELRQRLAPGAPGKGSHMTELDLLRKALAVENETSSFYKEMVRTLDGDGRRLFERFVEIEEGHQAIVQAEIDSVSGTGVWFDTKEFNLEMG
ncbi:MAG: ferritin family protein [Acidobacteria bacterium]|jgi:rubrerythrin|nr:ferritin family protein [Acidobacteriota bacterium]